MVCDKAVCVCDRERRGRRTRSRSGIQNQKQEPHRKMWGTIGSLLAFWLNPWNPKLQVPRSPSIILALQIVNLFRGHGSLKKSNRGPGGCGLVHAL